MESLVSHPHSSELNMRMRHGTLKDTGALEEKQTCLRPAFLLAACVSEANTWFPASWALHLFESYY